MSCASKDLKKSLVVDFAMIKQNDSKRLLKKHIENLFAFQKIPIFNNLDF